MPGQTRTNGPQDQSTLGSDADQAAAGMRQAAAGMAGLTGMTDPRRLLWLGGLAAAGAIGILEWPVVAAVGVGSYVAEQFAKDDARRSNQTRI